MATVLFRAHDIIRRPKLAILFVGVRVDDFDPPSPRPRSERQEFSGNENARLFGRASKIATQNTLFDYIKSVQAVPRDGDINFMMESNVNSVSR